MTDEEKKAIDYLQLCYDLSTITNESLSKLGVILNLIEKQSKEIEELKEKNKPQPDCAEPVERTEEMVNMKWVNYNYISKDKIKAKIEPVLKQLDTKMKEEYNKYGNSREYQDMVDAYNFLQLLLEKE